MHEHMGQQKAAQMGKAASACATPLQVFSALYLSGIINSFFYRIWAEKPLGWYNKLAQAGQPANNEAHVRAQAGSTSTQSGLDVQVVQHSASSLVCSRERGLCRLLSCKGSTRNVSIEKDRDLWYVNMLS